MRFEGYDNLLLETFGSVLRISLDRPERRNALSTGMVRDLIEVVAAAEQNRDISVLIVRGRGPSFCSGYDVSAAPSNGAKTASSPIEKLQRARRDNALFDSLWRCPIPTIAQVHGHCLAAGTDLALSCDLVVCATDARIGYPAVRSMGSPATHMWLYHLGAQWAKRLLLTGDSITGTKAAQLGLALEAVEPRVLDEQVLALATRMSWIPRDLLVANKTVVNCGLELMGRSQLQDTAVTQEVLARLAAGADTFWNTAMDKGVKHAVAERDAKFAEGDPLS